MNNQLNNSSQSVNSKIPKCQVDTLEEPADTLENSNNQNKTTAFARSSHASWLLTCPCTDGNFKPHLLAASEEEIQEVLSSLSEKGNKTKRKVLERELKRREKTKIK